MQFLLVHSPLVSRQTWAAVTFELEAAGHLVQQVALDNRIALGGHYYQHHAAQIQHQLTQLGGEPKVVVGHSGAGHLLTLLDPERVACYIFLDATFPLTTSSRFDLFDDPSTVQQWRVLANAHAGLLPHRVLAKFGEQVQDSQLRSQFVESLVDVPIALYEERIPVGDHWPASQGGLYVQWTESYGQDATRARDAGFDVRWEPGSHFQMLNAPGDVAKQLVAFASTA